MAQLLDLGKLRFNFSGTWNSSTQYEFNDVVRYGGNLYVYTYGTKTSSNLPTNYTYWTLLIEGMDYVGVWNSSTAYLANQIVSYGGKVYIAISPSTNQTPGGSGYETYWSQLVDGIQYEGNYNDTTAYQKNDVVLYGGIAYIAKLDTTGNEPPNATYWDVFVGGIQYEGTYSGSTTYQKNDIVYYDGSTYIALQDTTGNSPSNATYWAPIAQGTFPSQVGNEGKVLTTDGNTASWSGAITLTSLTVTGDADVEGLLTVGPDAELFVDPPASGVPSLYNPALAIVFDNGEEESAYAQVAFTNKDATSSTDIIAYMDNGNTDEGWIGMGISGSQFDDTTYGITGPGDGYIFHNAIAGSGDAGNLVFATGANGTDNKLIFAAGGFDSGLTQMEITPGVNVHVEIPTPSTSPSTGAFTVVGGVGVQGDMNIQGDVNIVGTISFGGSGTTVTTNNLAVSDPIIFSGTGNLSDAIDLGVVSEYAVLRGSPINRSVTNKALTSNVATLTTSANHGFTVGQVVVISGVDATFNGTYVVKGTPTLTTFTYDKTNANVPSAAVSPNGTAQVTHDRKYGGLVRDASDGKIKIFTDASTKPTTTVNFAEAGLAYGDLVIDALETTGGITVASGNSVRVNGSGGNYFLTDGSSFSIKNSSNADLFAVNSSGSITTLNAITATGLATLNGGISTTGNVTVSGRLDVQEIREDVVDASITSGVLTADYNVSNIFWLPTAPTGNFTVNLTNAPTDNGKTFTITVVVTQGATGFIPNTFQIGGVTPSGGTNGIRWIFNQVPIASNGAGRLDVFNFTLTRRASAWVVMGNASTNFPA